MRLGRASSIVSPWPRYQVPDTGRNAIVFALDNRRHPLRAGHIRILRHPDSLNPAFLSAKPAQCFGGAELALQVPFEGLEREAAEVLGAAARPGLADERGHRRAQHALRKLP